MGKSKVEFFEDEEHLWRWHLIAGNGEIVAQGESHGSRDDAERAVREVYAAFEEAESGGQDA